MTDQIINKRSRENVSTSYRQNWQDAWQKIPDKLFGCWVFIFIFNLQPVNARFDVDLGKKSQLAPAWLYWAAEHAQVFEVPRTEMDTSPFFVELEAIGRVNKNERDLLFASCWANSSCLRIFFDQNIATKRSRPSSHFLQQPQLLFIFLIIFFFLGLRVCRGQS